MKKPCIYCGKSFTGPRAANICPFCAYEAIKESKKQKEDAKTKVKK